MFNLRRHCQPLAAALLLLGFFAGPVIAQGQDPFDETLEEALDRMRAEALVEALPSKFWTGFLTNTDPGELDAIEANCTRDGSTVLTCDFRIKSVSRPLTPSEINERVEQQLPDFLRTLRDSERFDVCRGLDKQTLEEFSRQLEQKQAEIRGAQMEFHVTQLQDALKMLKPACDNPTKETAKAFLQWQAEVDSKNCHIATYSRVQRQFELQPGGRWVSVTGPTGECDEITIATLLPEPPSEEALQLFPEARALFRGTPLWTYEERVIVRKPNGDVDNDECRKVETTKRYTWQTMRKQRHCETVSF